MTALEVYKAENGIKEQPCDALKKTRALADELTLIKRALAAPVQEPVAWREHEFIQWGAKKYGPLVRAAINLLAEVDSKSYPQKYGVPYGAVNTLRDALTANSPTQPPETETASPGMDEMVNRFLTWPVPANVYPDGTPGQLGRTGTNLLNASEARQMLEHVLTTPPAQPAPVQEPKKDLIYSTVAMQEREAQRIERVVRTFEQVKQEQLAALATPPAQPAQQEQLGAICADGGTCHHKCTSRCFRRECCAPLSDYAGPWAYTTPPAQPAQPKEGGAA